MSLCPFSSSTSNMALGRAWVTAASITTASSFGCSPLLLSLRARAGRRGPRRGVDDLANSTTVYRSWSAPPAAASGNQSSLLGGGKPDASLSRRAWCPRPAGVPALDPAAHQRGIFSSRPQLPHRVLDPSGEGP